MALQWISVTDIPRRGSTSDACIVMDELELFYRSGHEAAEVDVSRFKSVRNAHSAYITAAKKMGLPINVITRCGRMFLVRMDALKKDEK